MSERLDLAGRVAVVTGASRGIGAAITETLAAHGMDIILSSNRNVELLQHRAEFISAKYNVHTHTIVGDISKPDTSVNLAKMAFSNYRRLDVWVNNAGVLGDSLIGMIASKDIDNTLGINLAGVIHGTQQAARIMLRAGTGSIINLTSIFGRVGNPGQLVYSASKAGVIGATLASARELAPKNIRVNAVAPGFIQTDMVSTLPADKYQERVNSIGMGRVGTPEDIADCVLFLASDMSRYLTGQVIGVDGGMVA